LLDAEPDVDGLYLLAPQTLGEAMAGTTWYEYGGPSHRSAFDERAYLQQ